MVSRFNQNAEAKRKVDLVRTNPSGSKTNRQRRAMSLDFSVEGR